MKYTTLDVGEWTQKLLANTVKLDFLIKERGLSIDIINKYFIGYYNDRYTIPLYEHFELKNIRFYSPTDKIKIFSVKDHGEARIFPFENLDNEEIYLCEGELDALLMNSKGYNTVTGTAGVTTFKDDWIKLFRNKVVNIVFDCDEVGKKSAKIVSEKLKSVVKGVKIINLGLEDKEDITDYFVKYNKTNDDFNKLVHNANTIKLYTDIHINKSLDSNYVGKRVSFKGIVIGKDLSPYLVPKKVFAKCKQQQNNDKCMFCPLNIDQKGIEYTFDKEKDKDFLIKCIGANDNIVSGDIRRILKVPAYSSCRYVELKIIERQAIEDLNVIPEINFVVNENQKYVIRRVYHFADDNRVDANTQYKFFGTTGVNPNNQSGINISFKLDGDRDDIANFKVTDEVKNKLKIFQPKSDSVKDVMSKLKNIYGDLKNNVTLIHKRMNVMMATDLTYHSVLHFKFKEKEIHKGWLECTIFGDTTTGKTETVKRMFNHYRLGEFLSSSENATLPGILGGVQQTNNGRWSVTWGKIPLNNHRIVALDESDELAKAGIIGKLSGVRRSGVAEIVKIQVERTTAMVRLLFLSNPIKGNQIDDHNYGLDILTDLFPAKQDLARVDFAIAVSKDEVAEKWFDTDFKKTEHVYTSDLCKLGVLFAWSRESKNIKLSKGIENYIVKKSSEFAKQYVNDIPLALPAEMKIKVARLAIALATRLYSVDDSGENVIIKKAHVDIVIAFLKNNYNSPFFGFLDYSEQKKREKKLKDVFVVDSLIIDKEHINFFLDVNKITVSDMEDLYEKDFHDAKKIIRKLRLSRAIKRKHQYYIKTSAFIKYLKTKRIQFTDTQRFIDDEN